MLDRPGGSQPEISYPCRWHYRIIGRDPLSLRAAVATIVGDREYELAQGNTSRSGRYHSVDLALEVDDEDTRLGIFFQLSEHADVSFVL